MTFPVCVGSPENTNIHAEIGQASSCDAPSQNRTRPMRMTCRACRLPGLPASVTTSTISINSGTSCGYSSSGPVQQPVCMPTHYGILPQPGTSSPPQRPPQRGRRAQHSAMFAPLLTCVGGSQLPTRALVSFHTSQEVSIPAPPRVPQHRPPLHPA